VPRPTGARVRIDAASAAPIPATTGYHRPRTANDHDAGLWVARQLADILTIDTDQAGTTVELHFRLTHKPADGVLRHIDARQFQPRPGPPLNGATGTRNGQQET
jgi:hypothetical protein